MPDFKCPRCSAGVRSGQPFCAGCGFALQKQRKGWLAKTLKGIGVVFLILVGAPVIVVIMVGASKIQESASTRAESTTPALDVQAAQLAAAYERNGVAADSQFKGRSLRVTGIVTAIGTDVFHHAVVTLDGRVNPYLQPFANLRDSEKTRAGGLVAGQVVVLLCTGGGDVIKAPVLNDCAFSS